MKLTSKRLVTLFLLLMLAVTFATLIPAEAKKSGKAGFAVVELFTSEG